MKEHPQLLLRRRLKNEVIYYPGFILPPCELISKIQFPYVQPFDCLPTSYHPLELVPLPEGDYNEFFSLQEEPFVDSLKISAHFFVHTLLTQLCSDIEKHLRTSCPHATHYIFSTLSYESFFIDGYDISHVTLEAYIEVFRFHDPRQCTFPFATEKLNK